MSPPFARATIASLLAIALVIGAPNGANAITCSDVYASLLPCLAYVQGGGGGAVPSSCCGGLKSLVAEAASKLDRQTACTCFQKVAAGLSSRAWALAGGLPASCGVDVPFVISPSTDCSRVS